jgi:hypothetical protein
MRDVEDSLSNLALPFFQLGGLDRGKRKSEFQFRVEEFTDHVAGVE